MEAKLRFEPSRLAKYDRPTFLAEMIRVANQFFQGQPPSHVEFNRHSLVHAATIVKEFGSWKAAWDKAGMKHIRSPVKTTAVVADLKRIHASTGEYFSYNTYRKNGGKYSHATIVKRFENNRWPQILEKVLEIRPKSRLARERDRSSVKPSAVLPEAEEEKWQVTPEQLLGELRLISKMTGKDVLSYHDYRRLGGKRSHKTFLRVFGTWEAAIKPIGLRGGKYKSRQRKPNYTNERFFEELQKVWEFLGRQPDSREMKPNGSKISAQAFQNRFGSWLKAIHAFCLDRNKADTELDTGTPSLTAEGICDEQVSTLGRTIEDASPSNKLFINLKKTPRQPSLRLRFKVFQRDKSTCQACGRSPAKGDVIKLEVDHIEPYSGLGETILDNLRLLCSECNSGKSDLPPLSVPKGFS